MPVDQITGVILAGGLGRRMGRVDKGLQLLNGRPMVSWVIERLQPQVGSLIINANQNLAEYEKFGCPVVPDLIPDFAGPLAGLHAALSAAQTPWVATAPCDSPFLPDDLVFRLFSACTAPQRKHPWGAAFADLAVARTFDQSHPVFCLCKRDVLPHLSEFLASGQRKMSDWYASLKIVEVAFDDKADAFENINTKDELGRFENTPTN